MYFHVSVQTTLDLPSDYVYNCEIKNINSGVRKTLTFYLDNLSLSQILQQIMNVGIKMKSMCKLDSVDYQKRS